MYGDGHFRSKKSWMKIQENYKLKKGKKCESCGSSFRLTLHHDKTPELPRNHPDKDPHVVILCETCHYQEDFWKHMKLYHKALMRSYENRMAEYERYWNGKKYKRRMAIESSMNNQEDTLGS